MEQAQAHVAVTGKGRVTERESRFCAELWEQTGAVLSCQHPEKMYKGTAKGCQNRQQEMKEGNSRGKVVALGL